MASGDERTVASMNEFSRIAFAPDGRSLLVTGTLPDGEQGAVLVDTTTNRQVQLRTGGPVTTWSFGADGMSVATDAGPAIAREVVVWSTSDGGRGLSVPLADRTLRSLALSRNSRLLAIEGASPQGTVTVDLWDLSDKSRRQLSVDRDPDPFATTGDWPGAAFSPTDDRLALVRGERGLNTAIELWEVGGAPSHLASPELGAFDVTGLAFSPDGRSIAAAGQEFRNGIGLGGDGPGGVFIVTADLDRQNGDWPSGLLASPLGRQHGVAFTHDGRTVFGLSAQGAVSVWAPADPGQPAARVSLGQARSAPAWLLAIAPKGSSLVVEAPDVQGEPSGVFEIVDTATGRSRMLSDTTLSAVAFSIDGRLVAEAMGSQVRVVRFDDLGTVATLGAGAVNLLVDLPRLDDPRRCFGRRRWTRRHRAVGHRTRCCPPISVAAGRTDRDGVQPRRRDVGGRDPGRGRSGLRRPL